MLSVHCAYLLLFRTLLSLSKSNIAVIFYLGFEQARVFSRKSELLLFNGINKKKKKKKKKKHLTWCLVLNSNIPFDIQILGDTQENMDFHECNYFYV